MSITRVQRGGLFVDGFNLYHALDDLGQPYLKWLSLKRLGDRISGQFQSKIDEIVFGTAFFPSDFQKRKRHEAYLEALRAEGVKVLKGHTTKEPNECKSCGHKWDQPREKETDINVALAVFEALSSDRVDIAFLISADTDQAATLKFVNNCLTDKKVIVLTPPGRRESTHLKSHSYKSVKLSETDIDLSILPAMIQPSSGRLIKRPDEYTPPRWWKHPDDRKK